MLQPPSRRQLVNKYNILYDRVGEFLPGFLYSEEQKQAPPKEVFVFARAYTKQKQKPPRGDPAKQEVFVSKKKQNSTVGILKPPLNFYAE